MNWTDDGLVIGSRPHGEAGMIVEAMTRSHGRHLGLVLGGRSRRLRPVLQPGNGVTLTWRARLDEQLGSYRVEADVLRAARLIGSPASLYGLSTLAAHLRLLPERDPHPELFEGATELVEMLDRPEAAAAFVRFEARLLADLGFGLDLSACAATGRRDDLAFVSPKSGRAVGREAGEPYRARLLLLPAFLLGESCGHRSSADDLTAGFQLTGHFLSAHVWDPRGQKPPDARTRFVALATGGVPRHSGMEGSSATG